MKHLFWIAAFIGLLGISPARSAYNPQVYTVINAASYGALPSKADNTSALTAAYNAVVATSQFGYVFIPCTGTYVFTTTAGFTWDQSKVGLKSCGATLNFTSLNTGVPALTVIGTNWNGENAYLDVRSAFEGFVLQGSGTGNDNAGFYFNSAFDSAHFAVRDVGVRQFKNGMRFAANSYLIHVEHSNIWENQNGVIDDGATSNSGENITFTDTSIFNNSSHGLSVSNPNGDYTCVSCSFDNNGSSSSVQISVNDSNFRMMSGHIEGSDQQAIAVSMSGAATPVTLSGVLIVQASSSGSTPLLTVTSGAYLNLFGGQIIANSGTDVVINVSSGAVLGRYGTQVSYGGGGSVIAGGGSMANFPSDSTRSTITGPFESNGLFLDSNFIKPNSATTISAANTFTTLSTGGAFGMIFLYDATSHGNAMISADPSNGCALQSATSTIAGFAGTADCQVSGGNVQMRVTSGTTPRTIFAIVIGAN